MLINIDWLQLNCIGMIDPAKLQTLNKLKYSTQVFKDVYEYMEGTTPLVTIACNPFSKILDPYTHLVKFHNKVLYSPDFVLFVEKYIEYLGLSIKGFSRLDICVDFQQFKYGLLPESLIRNFLNDRYLSVGNRPFKVHGTSTGTNRFEYLRFGKADSEISVYLYNKSLELNKVKDKPWIRESWKKYNKFNALDVWRLEFSLKGNRLQTIHKETGEVKKIELGNLSDNVYMFRLVSSLIASRFNFRYNDGKSNISRMKKIDLFENLIADYECKMFVESHESGRAEKIFIKKIESFNNNIRQLKKDEKCDTEENTFIGQQFIERVINYYDLKNYYEKKVLPAFQV